MILVLMGTHEAREMVELLLAQQRQVQVLVQSEYGKQLALADGLGQAVDILEEISAGQGVFSGGRYRAVIDATQPFPNGATDRANKFCQSQGIPYIRLIRKETPPTSHPLILPAADWEAAARLAADHGPNIFLTTGSHNLDIFLQYRGQNRLIVRVLPDYRVIKKCQDMGISPRDIIAMQGPYSKEFNRSMFKAYRANCIVSRDGGPQGGTDTKLAAALSLELPVILIKRQTVASGHQVASAEEAWKLLGELGI